MFLIIISSRGEAFLRCSRMVLSIVTTGGSTMTIQTRSRAFARLFPPRSHHPGFHVAGPTWELSATTTMPAAHATLAIQLPFICPTQAGRLAHPNCMMCFSKIKSFSESF